MAGADAWKEQARQLLGEVATLRTSVAEDGRATFRRWQPRITRADFAVSACNFAHYLAFRHHDLRSLQHRLMALGLSSLGRAESRVLASLDSVSAALAAMAGASPPTSAQMPSQRQFFRGESRLAANTEALFGTSAGGRAGRILVTLGTDAADDPAIIEQLAEHGADAVRINCAHDDADHWAKMIAHVRAAEKRSGQRIHILMDIAGPKVRTTDVATPPDRDRLHVGDEIILCRTAAAGASAPAFRTGCSLPQVFDHLKVGDRISIDDGKLRGTIVRQIEGGLVARIEEGRIKGGQAQTGKGLEFSECHSRP
jgi:pyruvate kinase